MGRDWAEVGCGKMMAAVNANKSNDRKRGVTARMIGMEMGQALFVDSMVGGYLVGG
jgi:hypothetical protein